MLSNIITMGVIYKVTCAVNNKIYIGKSKHSARHRWNQHIYESRNPEKASQSRYLNNAIRCHGEDCWVIDDIIYEDDDSLLFAWEEVFIALYGSMAQSDGSGGYNLTCGGGEDHVISEVTRQHMSDVRRGVALNVKDNRKREEDNELPKYVRHYTSGIREGYKVSDHPKMHGKSTSFTDSKLSMAEKLEKAKELLCKLDSGELVYEIPEVEPGIFKIHRGYRVIIADKPPKDFVYTKDKMPVKLAKAQAHKAELLALPQETDNILN